MAHGYFFFLTSLLFTLCSPHLSAQTNQTLADKMIVVINRNDPDSLAIGQYYARQRGIPESNIVQLSAPIKETVTIAEYAETVANPLLNALLDNKWVKGVKDSAKDRYGRERLSVSIHRIPFVVLVRGVPLRIANDPALIEEGTENMPKQFRVNNGSVDGEIALLLAPPSTSMTAFLPNPYFGKSTISASDANRINGPLITATASMRLRSTWVGIARERMRSGGRRAGLCHQEPLASICTVFRRPPCATPRPGWVPLFRKVTARQWAMCMNPIWNTPTAHKSCSRI
jgi:hypothetical protein